MNYLFSVLLIFGPTKLVQAKSGQKHPIYQRILELQPEADLPWAMQLSNLLHKYKAPVNESLTIALLESSLRNIHRVTGNRITDIGVFQIHYQTALNYNCPFPLLINSLEEQVKCHLKILKQKKRVCKEKLNVPQDEAWTCYHSFTERHRLNYLNRFNKLFPIDSPG